MKNCEFCKGTGERLLMWGGNDRNTKKNWETGGAEDGMRIVKERGDWKYFKHTVCPCSCDYGYQRWIKTQSAESFEAIKKLEDEGYLVKHKDMKEAPY